MRELSSVSSNEGSVETSSNNRSRSVGEGAEGIEGKELMVTEDGVRDREIEAKRSIGGDGVGLKTTGEIGKG